MTSLEHQLQQRLQCIHALIGRLEDRPAKEEYEHCLDDLRREISIVRAMRFALGPSRTLAPRAVREATDDRR